MIINENHYIKLFSNIIPVKGATQSILCDTQRGDYRVIPNDLYDLLSHYDGCTFKEILVAYGKENKEIIEEYVDSLYKEECIFFCDTEEEVNCFPTLDMTFELPSTISNAIIDVDRNSKHDYKQIIQQLSELGCENLEIRVFEPIPLSTYEHIFASWKSSILEYVILICPYNESLSLEAYENMMMKHQRIAKIVVHSCEERIVEEKSELTKDVSIFYTTQIINNAQCCGHISTSYFNPDLRFITEAIHFNNCLNQKISIDQRGNIKNCPAMSSSFGKMGEDSLIEVSSLTSFQKYWKINKDQIKVCRDCEFRYICQDCRAILTEPND
ncbi:MAG: grasp-with-spasm system SPASM domain peptide maturase, partial [Bacteroidota bacterium]